MLKQPQKIKSNLLHGYTLVYSSNMPAARFRSGPLGRWGAKVRVPGIFSGCFAESVPKRYLQTWVTVFSETSSETYVEAALKKLNPVYVVMKRSVRSLHGDLARLSILSFKGAVAPS